MEKENIVQAEKKNSKFKKVLYSIFVNNIGYKVLAVALSAALWLIAAGF